MPALLHFVKRGKKSNLIVSGAILSHILKMFDQKELSDINIISLPIMNPQYVNEHAYFDGLMTTPDPAENVTHTAPNTFTDLSSPITTQSKQNNQTLESKLQNLKKKYPQYTVEQLREKYNSKKKGQ